MRENIEASTTAILRTRLSYSSNDPGNFLCCFALWVKKIGPTSFTNTSIRPLILASIMQTHLGTRAPQVVFLENRR
jgi:hypothetical protein